MLARCLRTRLVSGAPRGAAHLQAWHRTRVLLMLSAHIEPAFHRAALSILYQKVPALGLPASVSGPEVNRD